MLVKLTYVKSTERLCVQHPCGAPTYHQISHKRMIQDVISWITLVGGFSIEVLP